MLLDRYYRLAISVGILWLAGCAQLSSQPAVTPPALRLGDAATPLRYAARLAVDPARDDFEGEISIDLRINQATKIIWLNATEIKISAARIELAKPASNIALKPIAGGDDFVGLQSAMLLPPGDAKIIIQYRGKLEQLATHGLFKQKSGNDLYVVSQFEAYDARRAFPCFDEPGWKTPWQITLDVPADLVAVSNTPQSAEEKLPNNRKRLSFAPTAPLPAYLIALAVGPFDVVDGGTAGMKKTPLRYLAPKGRGAEMRYAKENTPRLVELLENYFGMPYPYEKLDSVVIPQTVGFGAMENVGMITYAGSILLAKPHEESDAFRQNYINTAAHEIAHQWFGNLVTMKWWNDIWLNEAFATWLGNKITYQFKPEWDDGWGRVQERRQAMDYDRLASTRQVRNPVMAKDDIWAAFDTITYQKGGAVLEMFEASILPDRFREGVRLHIKTHAYGNAGMEDFVGALSSASGDKSLVGAFTGFIEQPGVPLIDVKLDCGTAPTLLLQQTRLQPAGSKMSAKESWSTPACFTFAESGGGKQQTQCFNVPNGPSRVVLDNIKSCPDWVMGNAKGAGYYVARYDSVLREQLRQRAPGLPAPEAIALLSDASLLTESGLQSVEDTLNMVAAHLSHQNPVVQQAALDWLKTIRLDWLNPAQQQVYTQLLRDKVVPLAKQLTWLDQATDSEAMRRLRETALPLSADRGGDSALRQQAAALARAWLGKRDAISAGMTKAVLMIAGKFADADLAGAMTNELFKIDDSADRRKILTALAQLREPALRNRTLAIALNEKINGREAQNFLWQALQDDHNRVASFEYVRKNFDGLKAKLPQQTLAQLMVASDRLCNNSERNDFVDFFLSRSEKMEGGPLIYKQALETMDLCIAARAGNDTNRKRVLVK